MDANGSTNIDDIPVQDEKAGRFFKDKLLKDAEKVSQEDIDELEDAVPQKLEGLSGKEMEGGMQWINTLIDRVRALFGMIRDRDYSISAKTKALVAAALIYFVLPTDLTPDFIPGIGYIDDAMVLSMLWKLVGEEVERYMQLQRRVFPE